MMRAVHWLLFACGLVAGLTIGAHAQGPTFQNQNTGTLIGLTNAVAGTYDSADEGNAFNRGLILFVNVSAISGTVSLVVAIQGKDPVSGHYFDLCTTAALTATGFTTLTVYPGLPAATNSVCSAPLPATWRVEARNGTGVSPSVTATIGGALSL